MILVNLACDECKHGLPMIDRCTIPCKAFPEGIPIKFMMHENPRKLKECNNGIGFERKEENNIEEGD